MTPQEASNFLRQHPVSATSVIVSGHPTGAYQEIADLIDKLAARELGPVVTLDQLKPSRNYFVVRDDDVVVVSVTRKDKRLWWPDEKLGTGYGMFCRTSSFKDDLTHIRSIHEIPAAWLPAAPPVKTEREKMLEKINKAIDDTLMSTGMHKVLKARIAAIVEGAK